MSRRRMIDPNLWQSEDVSRLSPFARLLLVGMISHADDAGRGRASPSYLKSIIFPYDKISAAQVERALEEIARNVTISVYEVHESRFYQFDNWKKWQRVDKPQPSLIPAPGDLTMPCPERTSPEPVQNDSGVNKINSRQTNQMQDKRTSAFVPPDFAEVRAYCAHRGNLVGAETFMDYYTANGWMMAKAPMRDWRARCRGWEKKLPYHVARKKKDSGWDFPQRKYAQENDGLVKMDFTKLDL